MAQQLNSRAGLVKVAKLAAAAALLLRIGGYLGDILPPASISLGLLALLLLYERIRDAFELRGRDAALASAREWTKQHRFALSLGAITLLALALRLFGITRDLGHIAPGIDENRLNTSILHLFRTGDIDYRSVEHYPGVHYWMLTGTYLLAYVWGLMTGVADTLARMPLSHFVAFGRVVSALQSTATVLLTGLLGRRLAGPKPGLLAAGLLALAPLSVSLGQQLRNDAAQTMLIVAAVLVALGIQRGGYSSQWSLLGGALAGLAAGVKYTGVFALVPVLLATVTCEDRDRRGRALGLVVLGFLAAALLSNHFVWYDLPNLVDQLSDQIDITGEGHWAAQDNPSAYHVRILAERVVGWPLLLVAAAMTAVRLAAGNLRWWLFAIYPLTYIGFVAQRPSQLPRWVYPSAPFAAVAAGAGLVAVIGLVVARLPAEARYRRSVQLVAPALVLVLFAPVLSAATSDIFRQLSPPTWELAENWLNDNAEAGDRILAQWGWLELDRDRFDLNRQDFIEEVLDGGVYEIATNDWVVVHEALLGHRALDRLRLAERIHLDPSFFGNQGPDFAIYRSPRVAPLETPLAVDLGEPGAARYLGHRWPEAEADSAGRRLPAAGAGLFLPPLGGTSLTFEVVIEVRAPGDAAAAIELSSGGRRLPTRVTDVSEEGRLTVRAELGLREVGPGIVALWLHPAEDTGPVGVLGFRVY